MSVFQHAWLSGLFADAEVAALWSAEAQMGHMLRMEAAWSRGLGASEAVASGIAAFDPDMADIAAGTARDGVPVPALVRQLRAAFGPEGIHDGLTSQDLIDTGLTFAMLGTAEVLAARLRGLAAALAALEARFGAVPLMGRTRMQAARQITFADRLAAWHLPLAAHLERLEATAPQLARLSLGGATGTREGITPAQVAALEAALGLTAGDKAWHGMRDGVGAFGAVLSLISGTLGKMGQDLALMAQMGEVGMAGAGGSSAMPHKQNPVLAELLVTLARFNAAQLGGLHQALVHEQERSGAAWGLEWMILPQMAEGTGRALAAGRDLVERIERVGS